MKTWAGCPNLCEIDEPTLEVHPPLECGRVTSASSDCDCGVSLSLVNTTDCTAAIEAVDFELICIDAGGGPVKCTSLEPGNSARWEQGIQTVGGHSWSLEIQAQDGPHSITVATRVSSFDDGGILCATKPGRANGPIVPLLFALGLIAVRRLRRR
jgi:hypothetical protein